MALPSGMATFVLTFGAAAVLGEDEPLSMAVTVTAATNAIWTATGQPFLYKPQTAIAPIGQQGSMTLISPDQAGFANAAGQQLRNWTYAVHTAYLDATGAQVASVDTNLAYLASMGPSVDLDLTVPVTTSAGVTVNVASSSGYDGGTEY